MLRCMGEVSTGQQPRRNAAHRGRPCLWRCCRRRPGPLAPWRGLHAPLPALFARKAAQPGATRVARRGQLGALPAAVRRCGGRRGPSRQGGQRLGSPRPERLDDAVAQLRSPGDRGGGARAPPDDRHAARSSCRGSALLRQVQPAGHRSAAVGDARGPALCPRGASAASPRLAVGGRVAGGCRRGRGD